MKNSSDLLTAIWQKNPEQVAEGIEQAHFETSHLQYNNENALSYTISLALYAARNFYTVYRELPSGKGFADMVYIPKTKFSEKPALLIELKWDHSAQGALEQIRQKQYCRSLEEYHGKILLVGINYDKKQGDIAVSSKKTKNNVYGPSIEMAKALWIKQPLVAAMWPGGCFCYGFYFVESHNCEK